MRNVVWFRRKQYFVFCFAAKQHNGRTNPEIVQTKKQNGRTKPEIVQTSDLKSLLQNTMVEHSLKSCRLGMRNCDLAVRWVPSINSTPSSITHSIVLQPTSWLLWPLICLLIQEMPCKLLLSVRRKP
jgi:hypothetical protein